MIDIADLKEDVHIDEVLAYYGGNVGGSGYGDWKPIKCPFCSDSSGSASVNRRTGYFFCHQCGAPARDNGKAGDIVDVVMFAEGIRDKRQAVEWITRTFR